MSFVDEITAVGGYVERNVELATLEIAEKAAEWAPYKTGQLKLGIDAIPPVEQGGRIVGVIISSARSESGFNYARLQHDGFDNGKKLGHFVSENAKPFFQGFADAGSGSSLDQRYRSGYDAERSAGKNEYDTKYLNKGYAEARPTVLEIMGDLSE